MKIIFNSRTFACIFIHVVNLTELSLIKFFILGADEWVAKVNLPLVQSH